MGAFRDITGQRFGRLTVQEMSPSKSNGQIMWVCRCDCGNIITVLGNDLKRGHTKSCGCFRKESTRTQNTKHGFRHTRIYKAWMNMKARCYILSSKDYKNYGGRGIAVCDEWRNDFKTFYDWSMANGYRDNLTIDRIDTNGGYCPENCRWVTLKTQANNTRRNHFVEYKGKRHTLSEWSEITGIKAGTLWYRVTHGWTAEKALEVKP